jgi:AcrR family transcriptional regulator
MRTRPARVGRPRANPRRLPGPAAEDILAAAARLFAEKGFGSTSTREIAAAAGLRQPSLFHYFPSKEAMLQAILDRSLAASVAAAERLRAAPATASVRLYQAIRFDVRHICAFPFDLRATLLPEARCPRFRQSWNKRARLIDAIRSFVRQGIDDGEFVALDPEIAANALFAMDEWTLSWFRRGRWSPDRIAQQVADLALRALLADPSRLPEVRRRAGPGTKYVVPRKS